MAFMLLTILIVITVVAIISHVRWRNRLQKIKEDGLHIFSFPPVWYIFMKLIFQTNTEINVHAGLFNRICGVNWLHGKERIFAVSFSKELIVHIYKPEYLKAILSSNDVIDKAWTYSMMHPWIGTGLLTSTKEKWRDRRKLLTPAFHFNILETFQPVFNDHSFILIRKLKTMNLQSWIDIVPLMSLCTLDIIGESAMGVHLKSQENETSEYVQAVGKMEDFIITRSMYPWLWPDIIFYFTSVGREFKRCVKIIHNFTKQVISERKREFIKILKMSKDEKKEDIYFQKKDRKPFLDLLLYHHLMYGDITEEDIREEVDTFMFRGHDTTAVGISWTLYSLGLHSNIQEKAYQELYEIFGDDQERPVTCDDMRKMKYLDCVIKESLRYYPPVPIIGRSLQEETKIGDVTLPKNSVITVFIHSIHRDREIYSDPEIFNPERFYPENCKERHPFAYIPFSAGPRNCIGQRFALMEEKVVTANILRHFRIYAMELPDKLIESGQLVLRSVNGLRLKFERR